MTAEPREARVAASIEKLRGYVEDRDFRGYDPYDALNSPILRTLSFGRKWPRIAFIQALKKSPLNVRPLLLVRRGLNPKGLGLFLWGYARLAALDKRPEDARTIERLLDLLEAARSRGWSGSAWGYNFDWQSRAFFVPRGTPTIVNTSFIGHALLDAHALAGSERALGLAVSIRDFLLKDLNRTAAAAGACFSYTPRDRTCVHNANLLGVSLLARLDRIAPDGEARAAARSGLAYTMAAQHEDGSWSYAETDYQKWIDSFHTGFNLQALKDVLDCGWGGEYRAAFEKGTAFYADRFFLDDGTPKYYHDRLYPVDIHSAAQALAFFSRLGPEWDGLCGRLADWMIGRFQDPAGFFYFQRTARFLNRVPYMRWSQAWAFHALTSFRFYSKR